MKFNPDYTMKIIPEEDFLKTIVEIGEQLNKIKVSGEFCAFDGVKIHYEYYLAENSKASIVVVHGLSEFTDKFHEFIYYCLNQGYNVFIYDQRCHGLSGRLTERVDLLHVDNFEDYVKDMAQFIDEIVLKTEDKPLYIYAHSMGAATAAMYLERPGNKAEKAILSVPMFEPVVNVGSVIVAREGVRLHKWLCGPKRKFFLTGEFDPDTKYKEEEGTSPARFEHNMNLRRANPKYQSTPMTLGWVYNSLTIKRKILRKRAIKNIKAPILLISADRDRMVENKPQYDFAKKCPTCKLLKIEKATHALLAGSTDVMELVLKTSFDFYRG